LDHLQICIAIAALAVHVPVEDWGAGGIVNWLSDEMKAHPQFIPGFLELLIVLPQVLIYSLSFLSKTDNLCYVIQNNVWSSFFFWQRCVCKENFLCAQGFLPFSLL